MVFEEGMVLIVLLNMVVLPLSEYLTASCLASKLLLWALNHRYRLETRRGEAAAYQLS